MSASTTLKDKVLKNKRLRRDKNIPLVKKSHLHDDSNPLISISEVFGPTVQGEGALIGTQTIFVRTAGCDYRCSWCDTGYAVLTEHDKDWKNRHADEIFAEIEKLSNKQPMWITLSGGNPAIQHLEPLIKLGQSKGYKFSMETQGSISKPWFALLDQLTLSPKPPSSTMNFKHRGLQRCLEACETKNTFNNKEENKRHIHTDISLKFVVADDNDLAWAKEVADQYPQLPCYVQPCNIHADITVDKRTFTNSQQNSNENGAKTTPYDQKQRMLWLIDAVQSLNWSNVRILPQLHVWLNVE